jgi:hypothetical protein
MQQAVYSYKSPVNFYKTTRRHIPQGGIAMRTSNSAFLASAQYVVNVASTNIGVSIVLQCVLVVTLYTGLNSLQGQEFFSSSPRPIRS